jgi:hypothetical protein
VRIYV